MTGTLPSSWLGPQIYQFPRFLCLDVMLSFPIDQLKDCYLLCLKRMTIKKNDCETQERRLAMAYNTSFLSYIDFRRTKHIETYRIVNTYRITRITLVDYIKGFIICLLNNASEIFAVFQKGFSFTMFLAPIPMPLDTCAENYPKGRGI